MEKQIHSHVAAIRFDPRLLRTPGCQHGLALSVGRNAHNVELQGPAMLDKEAHLRGASLRLRTKDDLDRTPNEFPGWDDDFYADPLLFSGHPRNQMRNEDLLERPASMRKR